MQIELIDSQDKIRLDLQNLKEICAYISDKIDPDDEKSLNIIFLSDNGIKELNRDYRKIDRVTDVLSFSYIEDSIGVKSEKIPNIIGEIYIAPLTAQKNAKDRGNEWGLELEIILLIIHGILHIYGYDHEEEEEKAVMFNIQVSLLHNIRNKDWN